MREFQTENPQSTKPGCFHPVLELVQAGGAGATVITPPDGSLDGEARRIVQAVRARYNVELAIITGDRALQALPTQHAIALGCLADSPLIEALYYRWNTLVDRWYPGSGGWVVQMIPSPYRQGHHVLLLGGSDPQGVHVATGRFVAQLKTSDSGRMSWQLEVQLGDGHLPLPKDRMDLLGTAASPKLTPESALPEKPYQSGFGGGSMRDHLLRLGMYGPHADNFHLSRSSQLGLRYLYTGRLEDAERYRRTLLQEARSGAVQKLYHYKSVRMFQLWALLGACPVFDDDREEITQAIRTYLLEESGVATLDEIQEASGGSGIFNRHLACDALNLWVGADWLWRRTGNARWLNYRSLADTYFEAQAGTDVPLTGLTEGYASYLEVYLEWMLLSCPDRIADDLHIRLWAQRVMALCTNTGQLVLGPQTDESRYPYHLMRKLAYLLADGRYLFVADLRERQVRRGVDRVGQFSAGQAYAGDVKACEPGDRAELITYPMNERLRKWKAPSISPGKGFDRAVARGGWDVEDDYLMIVGVRSGGKSLPNVGALAAYERFGQRLITSDSVLLYPSTANPWRHSVVTVNVGGLGAGMAEGAEVLVKDEIADGHLLSYRIDRPGLCRWVRLLYWKPSAYVLVVDRIVVDQEETFTLGVNWRCAGQMMSVDGGLATLGFGPEAEGQFYVQVSEGLRLEAESNAYPALGAPPGTPLASEVMLHATVDRCGRDGEVEVATLLHAVAGTRGLRYRLGGRDGGWIIEGPDETLVFSKGSGEGEMAIDVAPQAGQTGGCRAGSVPGLQPSRGDAECTLPTRWTCDLSAQVSAWAQAADGSAVALGTGRGDVVVLDAEGNAKWTAQCDAAVTALTFLDEDLIVGTRSGQVCRFDEEGGAQWHHLCRFRMERSFWPWWFLETPVVGALAVGHNPSSAQDLVVVGTGSTSLNFLEARTGALIEDVLSPFGLPDRIRPYVSASSGQLQFLVGHSWLACGSTVRAWSPPPKAQGGVRYYRSVDPMGRTMDEWDTCGVVDAWIGSLVRGMPDRVVVLRHGAVNQITVYDEATGDPLWDAGLGGAPVALAVVPGESAASARCYVAEQFGWLVGFDGTGRRVTATHVARSLRGMHAGPSGGLALWNLEELYIAPRGRGTDRYRLDGYPLGWYAHPQWTGLLCVQQEQLVMKEVRGWEG